MATPKTPQNFLVSGIVLLALACSGSGGSGSSSLGSPSGSPAFNSVGTGDSSGEIGVITVPGSAPDTTSGPFEVPPDTVFNPSLISANMISSSPTGSTPILGGGTGTPSPGLGLAAVTGFPGSVNMSLPITQVCATNLTHSVSDSCVTPRADGSFQTSISANAGDRIQLRAIFMGGAESNPLLVIVASAIGSSLPRGEILGFAESPSKSLFVATYEGIYYFNPAQTSFIRGFQPSASSPTPGEFLTPTRITAVNGLSPWPVQRMMPAEGDCVWAQHQAFWLFTKVCGDSGSSVTLQEIEAQNCAACGFNAPKSDGFGGFWITSSEEISHLRVNDGGGFDVTNHSVTELTGGEFVASRIVGPLGDDHAVFVIASQSAIKLRFDGSAEITQQFPFNRPLPLEFYQAAWASDGFGGLLGLSGVHSSLSGGVSGQPTFLSGTRGNTTTYYASTVQVQLGEGSSSQLVATQVSLDGTTAQGLTTAFDPMEDPFTRDFGGKHWFLNQGVGLIAIEMNDQGTPENATLVVDRYMPDYGQVLQFEPASAGADQNTFDLWVVTRTKGLALARINSTTNTLSVGDSFPIASNGNVSFANVTELLSDDTNSGERLWMGTGNGIWCSSMENGQEFAKHFPTGQSVESLYRDGPNHLLVGTINGFLDGTIVGDGCNEGTEVLWKTVDGTEDAKMYLASIPFTYVKGFADASQHPDGRGGVWIATSSKIARFVRDDSGSLQQDFLNRCFPTTPVQPTPDPDQDEVGIVVRGGACVAGLHVFDLETSPNGDLWVASDLGLDRFRFQTDGTVAVNRTLATTISNPPRIVGFSTDSVWITSGSRLIRVSDITALTPQVQSRDIQLSYYSPYFQAGAVDVHRNGLWLGTTTGALYVPINGWNTATPTWFTAENGYLPSDQISAIDTAENGRVYFGTYVAGVARFN